MMVVHISTLKGEGRDSGVHSHLSHTASSRPALKSCFQTKEQKKVLRTLSEPGVVINACNPNVLEAEAEGLL